MADKMGLIKELRDRTNAGMVDCKKALEENSWDIEKAIVWLKSNGKIKAAKKAGRVSAEGLVSAAISSDHKKAIIVEVNCETDFVAKNAEFKKLVDTITRELLKHSPKDVEQALKIKVGKETLGEMIEDKTATIGEKISLRRFEIITAKDDELIEFFVHVNGQIAALVKVKGKNAESARNVAMHAAAMKPEFVFVKEVPAAKIEIFKSEFAKPANFDKKPKNIQEMIMQGSLEKKLAEIVLEVQNFMMDEALTINKYLANHKNELVQVVRYSVGDGIEKEKKDFASEVAEQMAK